MFHATREFRKRLAEGQLLIGSSVYLKDPQSTEALAHSADFLMYDLEHAPMGLDSLRKHLMVTRHMNTPGFVRAPGPHPGARVLKPILDIGAHGVIVPQVTSVQEVREIVNHCRYTPLGQRGIGPLVPTNYGRDDVLAHMAEANQQLWVCVMIETADAVEQIEQIVATEGLDSLMIGPMDLSASYGVPGQMDAPNVVTGIEKIVAAARAVGMPVGCGLGADAESVTKFAASGVQWFQVGGDCHYLVNHQDDLFGQIRQELKRT